MVWPAACPGTGNHDSVLHARIILTPCTDAFTQAIRIHRFGGPEVLQHGRRFRSHVPRSPAK